MPTRNVKIQGLRRLFTKKYKVENSSIKYKSNTYYTGKIIINSQRLKKYIGEEVRVFVYGKRRIKPKEYVI